MARARHGAFFKNARLTTGHARFGHEARSVPIIGRVLEDWRLPFPGYPLWYASRRQPTPAFALPVEALRERGART